MTKLGLGQINSGIVMMQALGLMCVMVLPHVRGREDEQ